MVGCSWFDSGKIEVGEEVTDVNAVQIDYELAVPLDQMPALTPFATGQDLVQLLATFVRLEQFADDQPRKVDWRVVSTSGNAASLRSVSEPDVASRAALSLVRGLDAAERQAELPRLWDLTAGRRAAQVARRLGDTVETGLRLAVNAEETAEARITRRAARNLTTATKLRVTSYGSVIGVLGSVTAYRARRASLWSDVDGRRVDVRYSEQHTEDMRNAWAHQHVEITGVLQENAAGQVLSVNMDSLDIIGADKASLIAGMPRGFYPEMTGGLGTVEYLKAIRGED